VLVGDYLYGTGAWQKLLAVEYLTGKVVWQAEDFGRASVAGADGYSRTR
jgi:glucose dehydrogenase